MLSRHAAWLLASFPSVERLLDLRQIVYHPQLSAVITEQDKDVLSYMINLEVEEVSLENYRCRMKFFFLPNPYFRNQVIVKEYHLDITGYRASRSSAIEWFWDYEGEAPFREQDSTDVSFFSWLCEHNCPGSNRIAEIISEDLWLTPLHYYPRDEDLV
ncbi:testis-specific Y-encoded protein 1-like isoform X1 [Lemur catta]|uniref:testis-specific Y-encoded protein 1-like isoform X1 n=1 Tax=Lemur catta TaxID=9447 RepID=UPI001E26B122|nr:testis-specific Y-encoded protein 1-like isoform X1 [Lemur catta]XP_045394959.1 testis-specific Y-encoded protein 1-like isoform X1 [Lemur catta]XP_045394971.1 testis-specific Y-encoded protein 1-like isoform X1 [Lemur catta]XP_045394973.1 testis-specific Y-encoded protein 1-like isoform X1 [Lemur catta]